jgi:hypothetical protein
VSVLLTPEELAQRAHVTTRQLSHWRGRNEGPRFLRLPSNVIRYALADVLA